MTDIALHMTYTIPTPLKSVPTPLGIITTVFQAQFAASSPPMKATYMMVTTLYQFPGSGCSSRFSA